MDSISRFRAETEARGLPSDEVEEWIRIARPAVYASEDGDGPIAVRLGGSPMLPDDFPEPDAQFVAAVDCAALPPSGTDLPLPPDGQLLFFAEPDVASTGVLPDQVVYVPAGTPTTERPIETSWHAAYEPRQLRGIRHQLSWPHDEGGDYDQDGKWQERRNEPAAVWSEVVGRGPGWTLQIGGHPIIANWDPVEVAREELPVGDASGQADADDWVLLATWQCGEDVDELDHGLIHWVIRRQDLADLRFDRVYLYVDMI
jgi:hypothetical protein